MLPTNTKKILILFIMAVVLGCVSLYILFVIIKKNVIEAASLQAEVQDSVSLSDQNRSITSFLSTNNAAIASINQRIISPDGSVGFINKIEDLAKRDNIGIVINSVDLSPSTSEDPAKYEYLKLTITVQGSWNRMYTFMSVLQTLPYKSKIDTFDLHQSTFVDSSDGGGSGVPATTSWGASITFETLKQK